MAISPKDAAANQKGMVDESVQSVEDLIDEKLARNIHPNCQVCVPLPPELEALNFLPLNELAERLSATYRAAGWDVRCEGSLMYFSIAKSTT